MEEISALTPSEEAFFESGGETAPEETASTETENTEAEARTEVTETKPEAKEDRPEKMVSIHALHQARMENREMREKMAKMEKLFQDMQQRPQVQLPEFEQDPATHLKLTTQQQQERIEQLSQTLEQQQRQTEEQRQDQQLRTQFAQVEAEFSKTVPDYPHATHYLANTLSQQLYEQGYSQEQIGPMVYNQFKNWVLQAAQAGLNPAHFAYETAKARGYRPQPTQGTNKEKIESINKGQSAAKSLSSTSGKGEPELTLEAMAEMSEDDLAKNWHKIQKLM